MKYKTFVPEIHDTHCITLIRKALEKEFKNVEINLVTKYVKFEGDENTERVKFKLDELFKKELNKHGYTYLVLSLDDN